MVGALLRALLLTATSNSANLLDVNLLWQNIATGPMSTIVSFARRVAAGSSETPGGMAQRIAELWRLEPC